MPGPTPAEPRNRVDVLVNALIVEIGLRAAAGGADPLAHPLSTVYLGGGTPSLIPVAALERILDAVRSTFGIAVGAEITLEANPGPDERGNPAAQAAAGITRLSLGAQSFSASELKRLGRRHSASDIGVALIAAREAGIRSINLDLLYDVPGQTLSSWADGLERAIALGPEHLSLYALTLDDPEAEGLTGPDGDHLPPTIGARRWRDKARPEQDDDRAAAMYHLASHRLREAGFVGYELANWAQPGHESPPQPGLLGAARRSRRSAPARTRSTGGSGAGTPPASMPMSRPCCPPMARRPACRRAATRPSTMRPPRPRA